jgi:hypothetical protein
MAGLRVLLMGQVLSGAARVREHTGFTRRSPAPLSTSMCTSGACAGAR